MIVIPAIDIKGGRCVRLKQGRMSEETIYSEFPHEMAVKWFEQGAERLHLVDLDGAVQGEPVNKRVIENISRSVPIPIQLGGGIRDMKTIEAYLNLGIRHVILGTVAYKDPEFVVEAGKRFPGKIFLGIDAKKNHVAVEGWVENTGVTPLEIAKRFEKQGISAIIYTDIDKDGMSTGPNIQATAAFAEAIKIPVIASGGISGITDVEKTLSLSEYGVTGMITGKAIYEGTLDLTEAINLTKRKNSN